MHAFGDAAVASQHDIAHGIAETTALTSHEAGFLRGCQAAHIAIDGRSGGMVRVIFESTCINDVAEVEVALGDCSGSGRLGNRQLDAAPAGHATGHEQHSGGKRYENEWAMAFHWGSPFEIGRY